MSDNDPELIDIINKAVAGQKLAVGGYYRSHDGIITIILEPAFTPPEPPTLGIHVSEGVETTDSFGG